jgi:ferredoxin-type protein NapG
VGDQDKSGLLVTRRSFVGLLGKGALVVPLGGLIRALQPEKRFLRPPGAVPEAEFLSLCTRCGKCIEVCPRIITPVDITESLISAGTPRLIMNCARCMRCNYFCPTGALTGIR